MDLTKLPKGKWKLTAAEAIAPEVVDLLGALILEAYPDLAPYKIRVLFKPKLGGGKRPWWGKANVASERESVFLHVHGWIIIALDIWQELTPVQEKALLHHELGHLVPKDTGDPEYLRLEGKEHDIEEFFATLERYGAWSDAAQRVDYILAQQRIPELAGAGLAEGAASESGPTPASPGAQSYQELAVAELAENPAFLKGALQMCPTKPGESVTFSVPGSGQSVVLTSETRKLIEQRLREAEGK